jgi:2-amino-4-hydroxy-6-hydroxymethyldihydropteridine diphosphokinase
MVQAFIGLGSNVGDRLWYLQQAVRCLRERVGVQVMKASSIYETEPVGAAGQAWFLNGVVEVETTLSPAMLLEKTQAIEHELGRDTPYRWGPRTIDLDILLYDDIQVRTPSLEIPHAELCHRAFVMIPLLELAPDLCLPDGTVIKVSLGTVIQSQQVRYFAPPLALAS